MALIIRNGFDDEFLVLRKEEEATAVAAVVVQVFVLAPTGFEYLFSIVLGLQRLNNFIIWHLIKLPNQIEHIWCVNFNATFDIYLLDEIFNDFLPVGIVSLPQVADYSFSF